MTGLPVLKSRSTTPISQELVPPTYAYAPIGGGVLWKKGGEEEEEEEGWERENITVLGS